MQLNNPQKIQHILKEDWATIIKNITSRQELFKGLFHHTHRIFKKDSADHSKYKNTAQVQKLENLIAEIKEREVEMNELQMQIMQKYKGETITSETAIKLMGRVGAKILQLFKAGSDRARSMDQEASSRYSHFKSAFISILTQKDHINLEEAIKSVLEYNKHKVEVFLTKLEAVIKKDKKEEQSSFSPNLQSQFLGHFGANSQNMQKTHFCLKDKQVSVNNYCKQLRKSQKSRKSKNKTNDLYTIMLLTKNQANEETYGSSNDNIQRLYQQLLTKNKLNSTHIISFRNKYKERQPKPLDYTEKKGENKEFQNNSFGFFLSIKNQSTQESAQKDDYFQYIATEMVVNTAETNDQTPSQKVFKLSSTRSKLTSPQIKRDDFPHLTTKVNNQLLASIKADFSNQQRNENISNRFPNIKRSSLEQRKSIFQPRTTIDFKQTIDNMEESGFKQTKRRQSFFREQRIASQRTKMILKSVQVGLDLSNKSKKGERFCKEEQQCIYDRKKTDTTIESTIYMRKTINKFIDNKLSLFM